MFPSRAHRLALTLAALVACGEGGSPEDASPADSLSAGITPASGAPATDVEIWLAPLTGDGDDLALGEASNVTRREGYENQPAFLPDGSLLYTRQDDGRTDIWRYDPADGEHRPVTRTAPESEYSATLLPSGDGFSVIRVEADSAQRLWRFDLSGADPAVVFPDLAPVGYHAWADGDHAFLFILGDPPTLRLATRGVSGAELLAEDIGRSIQKVPGRAAVSYVQRTGEGSTEIRIREPGAPESERVTSGVQGGDDHAWTPAGVLLQGAGNVLYGFRPGVDTAWREVGRLPDGTVITRLAVRADGGMLALVVDTPPGV